MILCFNEVNFLHTRIIRDLLTAIYILVLNKIHKKRFFDTDTVHMDHDKMVESTSTYIDDKFVILQICF